MISIAAVIGILFLTGGCGKIQTPELGRSIETEEFSVEDIRTYQVEPLPKDAVSDTDEGAVKYGAVIKLGDLDEQGRSTYAHIRVTDAQEPGTNGESRSEYIDVDPKGWYNFKLDGEWVMNRCHLIGYQFSGLNRELRNLAPGTAYVNKGLRGEGANEDNPDSMLFYEQKLDKWLAENPDKALDLYVCPVYMADSQAVPTAFYMQWTGIGPGDEREYIHIEGHSEDLGNGIRAVLLANKDETNDAATNVYMRREK